jgi:hypothetical protein
LVREIGIAVLVMTFAHGAGLADALSPSRAAIISLAVKSFTASVSGDVPLGSEILVTIAGTPGDRAFFSIPNVVDRVAMQEVSSGVYVGRYSVVRNASLIGAAIVGRLVAKDGTSSPLLSAAQTISIDATRPVLVDEFPGSDEQIVSARPVLFCGFDDGAGMGVDPRSVRLSVDGVDVTAHAVVGPFEVSYQPPFDLGEGDHAYSIVATDAAGNPVHGLRLFRVVPPAPSTFERVSGSAQGTLEAGSTFTVSVTAAPGGSATATIPLLGRSVPLVEVKPGAYRGEFVLGPGDGIESAPVIVRFVHNGSRFAASLDNPISVTSGPPPPPTIDVPGPEDELRGQIAMRGHAAADSFVVCSLRYSGTSTGGLMPFSGNAITARTRVDQSGSWHMGPFKVETPCLSAPDLDVDWLLTAVSVNASGDRSVSTVTPVDLQPR